MRIRLIPNRRRAEQRSAQTPRYEGRPLASPEEDIFDQGLRFDLETMLDRRGMLKLVGYTGFGAGLLILGGCGSSSGDAGGSTAVAASATESAATTADCEVIPEETAGPYPGDGSNGPDVLSQSGVVRSDIRSSFGVFSGTPEGAPLTIKLAVQDAGAGCAEFRRPTATASPRSRASSRPATRAAGRTSTSRSTRAWQRRPMTRTRSRPPRLRYPKMSVRRCMPTGTARASRTCSR
jgi:hypothetical protein